MVRVRVGVRVNRKKTVGKIKQTSITCVVLVQGSKAQTRRSLRFRRSLGLCLRPLLFFSFFFFFFLFFLFFLLSLT
jgi:hypothetical protein